MASEIGDERDILSARRERGLSRLLVAYVLAGLCFMVFPGTLIGVWNLFSITGARPPDAAYTSWVQAHGHAQVFGWIGSFILGIGFYSIPKLRRLAWFPLSTGWVCWVLWTAGVLLRWGTAVWAWDWLPISALVELVAVVIFAANLALSFARPPVVPLRG